MEILAVSSRQVSGALFQRSCQDTEKQDKTKIWNEKQEGKHAGKMKEMQYKRALIKKILLTTDEEKEVKAVACHEKGGKMDRKTIAR